MLIADDIMTSAEAMKLLRLPRATFYAILREGRIPAFRVGKQYRFRRSILLQWIQDQEIQTHWRIPVAS